MVNWDRRVFCPLPAWGNVGVCDMVFRNKSVATMNYDYQPWKDYFAVLRPDGQLGGMVLLGLWTSREKTGGWFTLTHDPTIPM
jgi:hypothetical protein